MCQKAPVLPNPGAFGHRIAGLKISFVLTATRKVLAIVTHKFKAGAHMVNQLQLGEPNLVRCQEDPPAWLRGLH